MTGLPASGKSTFSKNFCSKYKTNSTKKFFDFINFDRTRFIGKLWHTLFYKVILFSPSSKSMKERLSYFKKSTPKYNENHTLDFFVKKISFFKTNYRVVNILKKNIIVNEGISQLLVVFAVEYELRESDFIKLVSDIFKDLDVVKVSYNITVDDCVKSFMLRNRHTTKIDDLEGEELRAFLSSFKFYIDILNYNFKYLMLSRTQTFENNCNMLINEV